MKSVMIRERDELRRHKLIYLLIMKSSIAVVHLKCRLVVIGWSC